MNKVFERNFRFPLKQRCTIKVQYLVFSKLTNIDKKMLWEEHWALGIFEFFLLWNLKS